MRPRGGVFAAVQHKPLSLSKWVVRQITLSLLSKTAETITTTQSSAYDVLEMITKPTDIVTAITGASGAMYAQRFIQGLVSAGVNVHLVVSPLGRRLLHDELGMEIVDLPVLAGASDHTVTLYNYNDVGSKLASGSFLHDGMVIVPCSSNTLAEVAHGLGDNLISRAAAVTLKERRRLVLVHREMPLSPIDVNNYKTLSDAGVILASANPGFYLNPTTVGEVVDFVAGKLLDLVGVPHALDTRWDPKVARPPMK
jgi:flavin prenyltransferase